MKIETMQQLKDEIRDLKDQIIDVAPMSGISFKLAEIIQALEGKALVPVEPTEAMSKAYYYTMRDYAEATPKDRFDRAYKAMLQASQEKDK